MKCLFYFYSAYYNHRWKLKCSPKVGDRILKCSGGKKQSEAGQSDCSFNFSYGNSGFSTKILTDVCFAYKDKIQHHCLLSFKLNRIRFLSSLL